MAETESKYVVRFPDGREEGPLGVALILDMAGRGVLPVESSVRREHGTAWAPLRSAFPGVRVGSAAAATAHTPMPIIVGGGGLYAVLDGNQEVTAKGAVAAGSFLFGTIFLVAGGVALLLGLGGLALGLAQPEFAVVGALVGVLLLILGVRRYRAARRPG